MSPHQQKQGHFSTPPLIQDDYSPVIETRFIQLVEEKSGIIFDHIKRREIKQNLTICMEEIGESSYCRYYERLIDNSGEGRELKKLINFITINETFFPHQRAFRYFPKHCRS